MGKAWIAADGLGVDSSAVECKAKSWYPKKPILKTHTLGIISIGKTETMEKQTLFMVMRLSTSIEADLSNGEKQVVKLGGIAGFLSVYDTLEQAQEAAENGRFEIVPISAISDK